MPFHQVNGAKLHYTDEGEGPETIVFSHGLLFSGRMFDAQVALLKDQYRCITFDHRGQGQSQVTETGYDMDGLTVDAAALIRELDAAPCHFVGLSMGGFVGMRLALRQPELLKSLILIGTSADFESGETQGRYRKLNFIARWFGLRIVMSRVMPILFGRTFLEDKSRAAQHKLWRDRIASGDRIGITRAVRGVIERSGTAGAIMEIRHPTLVVVGEEDVATVPAKSERMHASILGSKLITIPRAGHSSTIEQPGPVTVAISSFIENL